MSAPADPASPVRVLVGGPLGAVESALPSLLFVTVYVLAGSSLVPALAAAVAAAVALAAFRLVRRERPVRVLAGLLAVTVAAVVAARTGNAVDYFLPSLLANVASALAWSLSILVRWPLLGVVLGFVLRTGTSWRQDDDLVRAYARASWIWAASFVVRAAVQVPLYLDGHVVALGVARLLLGWPLVLAVVALSWVVIRQTLPVDHPGLTRPRPRVAARAPGPAGSAGGTGAVEAG